MSTFDGLVPEFPDIRIDFFRQHPGRRPPLACFLSHVHSDHLAGLDASSFRTFIYCSAATREMLLRLERYPARVNFARGTLEARVQTYKHLKRLLRPIPMATPARLELGPGNHMQVTLLPANHCPGSVMFLIEGSGKAILYTGDVRCEPWFVTSLVQNPSVVQYTHNISTLDKIYLDTSFLHWTPLQTKAEGIARLIREARKYPDNTIFHLETWTYGYENVWIALSHALDSRIHVDDYKLSVYSSLVQQPAPKAANGPEKHATRYLCPEAASLVGHVIGNSAHAGCLTNDETVRLHSCEKGNYCTTIKQNSPRVIWIRPVVALSDSGDVLDEVGVGGGGSDLSANLQLECPVDGTDIDALLASMRDLERSQGSGDYDIKKACRRIKEMVSSRRGSSIDLNIADLDLPGGNMRRVLDALMKRSGSNQSPVSGLEKKQSSALPGTILFPYARHSSLPELRHLVESFRPKDVWPCTVHTDEWYEQDVSIRGLFGDVMSVQAPDAPSHDVEMQPILLAYGQDLAKRAAIEQDTQTQKSDDCPSARNMGLPLIQLDSPPQRRTYQSQSVQPHITADCPQSPLQRHEATPMPRRLALQAPANQEHGTACSMDADHRFAGYIEAMDAAQELCPQHRPDGDVASWDKGFEGASMKLRGDQDVELGLLSVKGS